MAEGVGNVMHVPSRTSKSVTTQEEILFSYVGYTQTGVIIESGSGFLPTGSVLRAGATAGKYRAASKANSLTGLLSDEVQQVAITGTPTGGTFTLTWSGQTTTAIAFNATAAQVQAALAALSNIGTGNVTVTGGPGPGTAWQVAFVGTLADVDQPAMTHTDSLTGGSSPAVAVTTPTAGGTAGTATEVPLAILRKDVDATSTDMLANIVFIGSVKGDKIKFSDQLNGGMSALELAALAKVLGGKYSPINKTVSVFG